MLNSFIYNILNIANKLFALPNEFSAQLVIYLDCYIIQHTIVNVFLISIARQSSLFCKNIYYKIYALPL